MEWLPIVLPVVALLATGVAWLLLERSSKERTAFVADAANARAAEAKGEAKAAHDKIAELDNALATRVEAHQAVLRDLARLGETKADVSVVNGIQNAIGDVKSEMIRQFDRLEARLDQAPLPRSRKGSAQ